MHFAIIKMKAKAKNKVWARILKHCLQPSISELFFSFETVPSSYLKLFSRSNPDCSVVDSPTSIPPPNAQIRPTMIISSPLPAVNISFREELVYVTICFAERRSFSLPLSLLSPTTMPLDENQEICCCVCCGQLP